MNTYAKLHACLTQVMDSWRNGLANIRPKAFQIDLEDVRIFAADNHAYVTCVEIINADENKGR
jgi:2'-5' RNA ligase